jgi:NAD(P)H-nitrite reductase large subunit
MSTNVRECQRGGEDFEMTTETAQASTVLDQDPEKTICFCYNVPLATIAQAIDDGAVTLELVREKTNANTGCGGCEADVCDILAAKEALKK